LIRVIFNADDFGFTRDVNEGIVEAHRHGVLTATTLMANGDAFDHAVACARDTPTLDIGVHLVMVQGQSVARPGQAMPATLQELAFALLRRQIPVYEEAAAQVRKIIAAGIRPSHIDTHKHTHLFPPVMKAVTRVAKEFDIPWVRQRLGIKVTLAGLRTTDHFVGFGVTGRLDEAAMIDMLEKLSDGLTEFMCHPGKCGPELQGAATRLKESRAVELAALTSPEVRRVIERRGIRLTDYRTA
jgi:chitin disaccharide deacetylase